MPSDQLSSPEMAAFALFALATVLVLAWCFFQMPDRISALAAGFLAAFGGSVLLNWKLALVMWGIPIVGFLAFWAREASYAKRFPVFSIPPLDSIKEADGFTHHLHLREWKSLFIIGVDYELQVDGSAIRYQTRWKDRFTTRESAEIELRRRLANWLQDEARGQLK